MQQECKKHITLLGHELGAPFHYNLGTLEVAKFISSWTWLNNPKLHDKEPTKPYPVWHQNRPYQELSSQPKPYPLKRLPYMIDTPNTSLKDYLKVLKHEYA